MPRLLIQNKVKRSRALPYRRSNFDGDNLSFAVCVILLTIFSRKTGFLMPGSVKMKAVEQSPIL
jgi:hypothetical protein